MSEEKEKKENENKYEPVNLYAASNYLVHLFKTYRTKFQCTPVKIQKMILILQILYIVKTNGRTNYSDITKIVLTKCSCKIPEIALCIPNEITDGIITINKKIDLTPLDKQFLLKSKFDLGPLFEKDILPDCSKELLIDLFDEFGGFSSTDLGAFFDVLKPNDNVYDEDFDIPINTYNKWILDRFDNLEDCIKNFVKEH